MDELAVIARLVLIATFGVSGIAKLLDPRGTRTAVEQFRVPLTLVGPTARALPIAELVTAAMLANVSLARAGAVAALVLLAGFVVGIVRVLSEGERPDCHCFGQLHSKPVGPSTLVRNASLMVLAAVTVVADGGMSIDAWQRHSPPAQVALVALTSGIVAAVVVIIRRRAQGGDQPRQGLAVGTRAPGFHLPDLHGGHVALEDLLARNRKVVLFFISPGCGPCRALLPDIAQWQRLERLSIAVLVAGSAETIGEANLGNHLRDVLVDEDALTRAAYGILSTPGAVLVAPDGTILTDAAIGSRAIEHLILEALGLRDLVEGIAPPPSDPGDGHQPADVSSVTPLDIDAEFRAAQRSDVVLTQRNGEDVLVDQRTAAVHLLNPTAAVIWQILDPSASIEDLAIDVSDEFGAPLDEVRTQLIGVVRHFGQLGLLDGVTPLAPETHDHAH